MRSGCSQGRQRARGMQDKRMAVHSLVLECGKWPHTASSQRLVCLLLLSIRSVLSPPRSLAPSSASLALSCGSCNAEKVGPNSPSAVPLFGISISCMLPNAVCPMPETSCLCATAEDTHRALRCIVATAAARVPGSASCSGRAGRMSGLPAASRGNRSLQGSTGKGGIAGAEWPWHGTCLHAHDAHRRRCHPQPEGPGTQSRYKNALWAHGEGCRVLRDPAKGRLSTSHDLKFTHAP